MDQIRGPSNYEETFKTDKCLFKRQKTRNADEPKKQDSNDISDLIFTEKGTDYSKSINSKDGDEEPIS
jgi:hypothetical protein